MKSLEKQNDQLSQTACHASPIGLLKIESKENYITRIQFSNHDVLRISSNDLLLKNCANQLDEYFFHKREYFDLPIKFSGTAFQVSVWKAMKTIPFGKTVSYSDIAKNINNRKAVRAVGAAIHNNPIVIIVPCHRVVGSNGKLIGFGGGLWRKKWLLTHEKNLLL